MWPNDRTAAATLATAAVAACAGCPAAARMQKDDHASTRRDAGTDYIQTRLHYGIPILQKSFFWDGNGEVDNSGIGVRGGTYVADGVALGIGSNLTNWWKSGRDVLSLEVDGQLRLHPWNDCPLYCQGGGGYQLANDQIPPGGTVWNFTFTFGAGFEFPIASSAVLQTGVDYHHISNALGRDNERNPSQNEARLFVGVEWRL